MSTEMPWEMIELPFRGTQRPYKRYPNGVTVVASDEDAKIWKHVRRLESVLAELWGTLCPDAGPVQYEALAPAAAAAARNAAVSDAVAKQPRAKAR